jgi:hypothetical protein
VAASAATPRNRGSATLEFPMFVHRPDARLLSLSFGQGPLTLLAVGGFAGLVLVGASWLRPGPGSQDRSAA